MALDALDGGMMQLLTGPMICQPNWGPKLLAVASRSAARSLLESFVLWSISECVARYLACQTANLPECQLTPTPCCDGHPGPAIPFWTSFQDLRGVRLRILCVFWRDCTEDPDSETYPRSGWICASQALFCTDKSMREQIPLSHRLIFLLEQPRGRA